MIRKKKKRLFIEVKMKWQPGQKAVWINNSAETDNVMQSWQLKDTGYDQWPPLHLLLAALTTNYLETLRLAAERSGATILLFKSDAVAQVELDKDNTRVIDINFYPEIDLKEDGYGDKLARSIDTLQAGELVKNTMSIPVIYHTIVRNVA